MAKGYEAAHSELSAAMACVDLAMEKLPRGTLRAARARQRTAAAQDAIAAAMVAVKE